MKKLPFVALIVAGLALSGCVTDGVSSSVTDTVGKVQDVAVKVCGFLPTVGTVTALLTASPEIGGAVAIANAICKAVTAKSVTVKGVKVPVVNGVEIHGRWVK